MTAANYPAALDFVWRRGFDSPLDGYHVSPGDPGGGTFGGVIEATWADAVKTGLVEGTLAHATTAQLSTVLHTRFWGLTCDALPDGMDLLLFNGRMMSGRFPSLLQQCLGFFGNDVDNWIGPKSLKAVKSGDTRTLINAVTGAHFAYLSELRGWPSFRAGWTQRLGAARLVALAMAQPAPVA